MIKCPNDKCVPQFMLILYIVIHCMHVCTICIYSKTIVITNISFSSICSFKFIYKSALKKGRTRMASFSNWVLHV